jgi:hypothetical protein
MVSETPLWLQAEQILDAGSSMLDNSRRVLIEYRVSAP